MTFCLDKANQVTTMYRVCCLILAAICAASAQDYTPICDPNDYKPVAGQPSLPDFPEQFSFTIEAVLGGNRNNTIIVSEYFDEPGNRGRLDVRFNGTDSTTISDYNSAEIFIFPNRFSGDECTVYNASNSQFVNRTFGVDVRNGTLHIGSPVRFIEQVRDDTAVRFHGMDEIRGIPVMHWRACNSLPNNSFIVNYYFAPRSYDYNGESAKFTDDDDLVPIQFELIASRINGSEVLNYTNLYNFYNFKSGPDSVSDDVFAVPLGLRCKGRTPGIPTPNFPDFFSMSIENVGGVISQNVQTFRETYDLQHNLFRIDAYYNGGMGGPPGPASVVHDFNIGVEYTLNNNIVGCQIQPLTGSPYLRTDIATGDNGTPTLVPPNELFARGNDYNYTYEGVTTVRGIEVDSWISVRDFEQFQTGNGSDLVYEIFFTRPGWNVTSGLSQTSKPVPVRFKISGTFTFINGTDNSTASIQISSQNEIFDFSTSEPSYDAFDISLCYGRDDYHYLLLAIPGHKEGVDYGLLKRDVRAAVVNLTGLRPTQVASVEIRGDNSTHLFVGARLYNLTMHANIDPKTNITADKAYDIIVNSTKDNMLPFKLTINNTVVFPSLYSFRRRNGSNDSCDAIACKNCTDNITTKLKLTDGIVAGIAIGLFFGGMIIGIIVVLICCCFCKWYRSGGGGVKSVKYQRHDDDVDVN